MLIGMRGLGLTCPSGQVPTAMYTGDTVCCGAPGTPPEADPCSYVNTPQYVATQTAAAAAALAPGGAGPMGAALLESVSQYPQNVQKDALNCVSNPGLTFVDDEGISITCPAAETDDNGIYVSIYTPAQIAAMISGAATPATETAINVAGTTLPASLIQSAVPSLPGYQSTAPVASTVQGGSNATAPAASSSTATTGSTSSNSTATSTTSTLDLSFLTNDSLISGVPNWGVAAGVIIALMFLPKMMGGR